MPKPVYQRIKEYILYQIHHGIWRAGMPIASENELATAFGVSRMTVNRAVNELTSDGVLTRKQGSGTFVSQRQFSHTFVTVHNIRHDIESTGKRYHAKVISKRSISRHDVPEFLVGVFDGSQDVFEVVIVHFGDDVPLQVEVRYVDLTLVPDFKNQDFNRVNTSDYLIEHVPLVKGRYFIQAVHCPSDIAQWLNCQSGLALRLSRYTYSGDKVVTYVQMWHDGERFEFGGELEKSQ
ncbi:UTRA domain-containing protein [Moraxella nasovis]|uniref:UTRA domain-containing protein n=1 Tax=Moraxella nasovis TaxID=2904121 RepID=UPI001F602C21|nr:UTRA domain-containing protein [Moraxella nasovis]UNU73124.1 UTRA domain-containing protein [Moraxella nasovis]